MRFDSAVGNTHEKSALILVRPGIAKFTSYLLSVDDTHDEPLPARKNGLKWMHSDFPYEYQCAWQEIEETAIAAKHCKPKGEV